MDYVIERSQIRVSGTIVFNYILVVFSIAMTAVAILVALKSIIKPIKKTSSELGNIVEGIRVGEGDLTARVPVKANDEVNNSWQISGSQILKDPHLKTLKITSSPCGCRESFIAFTLLKSNSSP